MTEVAELMVRLGRIQTLTDALTKCQRENVEQQRHAARIQSEQDAAQRIHQHMRDAEQRLNRSGRSRPQ